jgi:hypothetical protein
MMMQRWRTGVRCQNWSEVQDVLKALQLYIKLFFDHYDKLRPVITGLLTSLNHNWL